MPLPIPDDARRVVIIGPGKIGCGYLAPLFAQAGWQVVLAARSPEVVDAHRGRGPLRRAHDGRGARRSACTPSRSSSAARRSTARWPAPTSWRRPWGWAARVISDCRWRGRWPPAGRARPIDVWAVENADVGPVLRDAVRSGAAALGAELPARRLRERDRLRRGDAGRLARRRRGRSSSWTTASACASTPARSCGRCPELPGVGATNRYDELLRDKRFVFGAGHALCAYLGLRRGHRFIHEAVRDPLLLPLITTSLEASRAVIGDAGVDGQRDGRGDPRPLRQRRPARHARSASPATRCASSAPRARSSAPRG